MLSESSIIKSEVYTEILSSLIASYVNYARKNNIDLDNKESDFTKFYYKIVSEHKMSRFYTTEEELENCKEFIRLAKENLSEIGGNYI